VNPLLAAIRREVGALIAKLHKQDFGDGDDPMSAMGGGASPYMKELSEKLTFIKTEILSQFNAPDVSREWSALLIFFTVHIDIITF
jgi:conserved oligomeric Golgi complex subunit 5